MNENKAGVRGGALCVCLVGVANVEGAVRECFTEEVTFP